jgi:hypothetical protein
MDPELRAMFQRVTKGALSGNAGQPAKEDFKINGQYVNTPVINGQEGVVGIPFFDEYVEKASLDYLDRNANSTQPLFMSINFMKAHQPNMPAPEFQLKSLSKTKYADSVVENDTRIGRIMDKVRSLVSTRTRTSSGRPTTVPGRTSILMLAMRHFVAPRHSARGRQPRSGAGTGAQNQSRLQEFRRSRRPGFHGHLCFTCRIKAAGKRSRRSADHL